MMMNNIQVKVKSKYEDEEFEFRLIRTYNDIVLFRYVISVWICHLGVNIFLLMYNCLEDYLNVGNCKGQFPTFFEMLLMYSTQ